MCVGMWLFDIIYLIFLLFLLFQQMIVLPPSSAMPRSFLVKRGGIHYLRTAERSPSPGRNPFTLSDLRKQTGSSDASLVYSATETPDTNLLPITLLQQDIQAATHSNGNVHSRVFSDESYTGCRSCKCRTFTFKSVLFIHSSWNKVL